MSRGLSLLRLREAGSPWTRHGFMLTTIFDARSRERSYARREDMTKWITGVACAAVFVVAVAFNVSAQNQMSFFVTSVGLR